jgi:hypothetical protein
MSRADLGAWALDLDDATLARALAALGMLHASGLGAAPVADPFSLRDPDRDPVALAWPDLTTGALPDPLALAGGWEAQMRGRRLRLEITPPPRLRDVLWLADLLSRDEVGAASVYVRADQPDGDAGWRWPLVVGVLPDAESDRLLGELAVDQIPWPQLVEVRVLADARPDCDLLLLPWGPRAALGRLTGASRAIRADCVVALGRFDEPGERVMALAPAIRALARSAGLALTRVPRRARSAWFRELVRALAHDQPLDVALFTAARETQGITTRPRLVFSRRLAEAASATRFAARMAARAERTMAAPPPPVAPPRPTARAARPPDAVPPTVDTAALGPIVHRVRWLASEESQPMWRHEEGAATDLVHEAAAAESHMTVAEAAAPDARYVQATVSAGAPPAGAFVRDVLRPDTRYTVAVRIARPDAEWIVAGDRFRDELLPPSATGHRLTVVFSEPRVAPEPQVDELFLPPAGPSAPCVFRLTVPAGVEAIAARIVVLHRGRVLQTALLRARVLPAGSPSGDAQIRLEIENVVRPQLDGLDQRSSFDAALVLNHTDAGDAVLTKIAGDRAALVRLLPRDIDAVVETLGRALSDIATNPASFATLDAPGTTALLRTLAQHGRALYRAVVKDHDVDGTLAAAERVQIVSARADAFLPVEFLYVYDAPDDTAPVCPYAAAALAAGACDAACPAGPAKRSVVCPLGFWSLRVVIERHAHRPRRARAVGAADFALLVAEPGGARTELDVFGGALFAASERAERVVPGSVDRVVRALTAHAKRASSVPSWDAWVHEVRTSSPTLLLLVPHVTPVDHEPALEIGQTERLKALLVREDHVHRPGASPGPLVVLLGCETGVAPITFESFPASFREAGASIVVSTVATVLGRHAAPVAERLVQLLASLRPDDERAFGDVMRRLRREMLAAGIPMVLALTAYGDADWRIAARPQGDG